MTNKGTVSLTPSENVAIKPITVIAASAGTGKTYRLSREYLKGLGAFPDKNNSSIIATTFTNKAADELLERIRHVLLDRGEWLAAQNVLSGYLGTVNALCGRLLSEYAIEAGLSPDLTVIGEERLPAVFAIAVDSVIHRFADEMYGPATRLQLDNWRQNVQSVIDSARHNNVRAEELEGLAEESWKSLKALLPPCQEADADVFDQQLAEAIETVLALLPAPDDVTQSTRSVIETLRDVNLRVKSGAHVVWQSWANMSKLTVGKNSREIVKPLIDAAQFYSRHPRLHSDIETMIFGVFRCAAAAMQTYADYKREHGLIDFVDQELLTLELLKKPSVRDSLREKAHLLLVDEFQDTSPIQLAIFLELARLVEYSVWVGDEKQSIFGFRGSDPELMRQAVEFLVTKTGGTRDVLATSYRSRPKLVSFTNELFSRCSQLKHITSSSSVIETVDRKEIAEQNDPLHVWWLKGKKQEQALAGLAAGIADVLRNADKWPVLDRNTKQVRPIKGSDIAILCTYNDHRFKTARALVDQGLTVATERDALLDTEECVLACAALRAIVDSSDTLAVAEIANLLSPNSGDWLNHVLDLEGKSRLDQWLKEPGDEPSVDGLSENELSENELSEDKPSEHKLSERQSSEGELSESSELSNVLRCLRHLQSIREDCIDRTPSEVLEEAINGEGIIDGIISWGNIRQRLANLDSLRGIARSYEDLCRSARVPATAAGLIVHLHKYVRKGGNQPANPDENGIHIITYHKSKGLEWPMVVLTDLNQVVPGTPFGVKVESVDGSVDPLNPLAGRTIRYWPWPFGKQKAQINLKDASARTPQGQRAARRAVSESVRLLYVGMTRARDYLIFGCRNTGYGTAWLNCLTDEEFDLSIMTLSDQGVAYKAELIDGVPASMAQFTPMDEPSTLAGSNIVAQDTFAPPSVTASSPINHVPYYLNPSNASEVDFEIETLAAPETVVIGDRIPLFGTPDMRTVGDCVHAFLTIDNAVDELQTRMEAASRVVAGFNIDTIAKEALPVMTDRLLKFLNKTYPNAEIRSEMPVSGRLKTRRVRGTVDMLVETEAGFIIIDHKTFPGKFEEWEARAITYAPQLALYRHMIEQATGKPVIAQYIHMPVVGAIIKLDCRLGPVE
ncbi:MAG: UvrD-helicase domain-containing protein [Candidatus Melainabacteria bacterium]|nr:UvrD-helicase domain-containing protein [Candidatus Melainabacteria bacterium]